MNELTTEIIAALAQKQDLDEVFRHHLEIAINQLLQTELAEFLGYELNYLGTVYFNKYCNFKRIYIICFINFKIGILSALPARI